ncbi:GGDEF domain-containing protein [Trebonia kvetii]|uniref:GGDEF domain-containing protein n=1 Tax=Trebonia kvetii TaxID=2480626 RepID=A0A6P2C3I0_9ACTN|nr:GGDEF domain-containing phosphodiesterase [Trebonia kvetii]TVZ05934.1 GGDEF domain-containing protein [Trebonia kvetii]
MSAPAAPRGPFPVNGLVAGYVVVAVAAGLGRWWSPAGASLLLGLATAVVLAAAPVLYPVRDAAGWLALAASAVLFTTVDVIYPLPSAPVHLVDVLYVPVYALYVVALRRMTRGVARSGDFWDAGVLAAGLVVVLVLLTLTGRASRADARNLSLLYPLADLVILALSVRLTMVSRRPSAWLLIAAAIWLLASGFVTALSADPVADWLYQTLRTGFLACWGLAALWPPPQRFGADGELDRGPRVWLFALVVLLVPAGLLIQAARADHTRGMVVAVACAAAGMFVVARLGAAARATATDPVTGLMVLPVLLTDARAQLAAGKDPTLFLVELDQFHVVSETVGRRGADEVLRRIARQLVRAAGDARVARGSLERFAVLADLPAAEGAGDRLAAGLAAAVARPMIVDGQRVHPAYSLGYATAATGDVDDLILNTEVALHAAKNAGPSARIAYHPGLRETGRQQAMLIADLREAIGGGQLLLEYQPIAVLADGLIVGFEALVRWQHPRLGRLGPDRFVHLAESEGLIGDLGAWVLSQGVAGAVTLNTAAGRPVFVDINVSPVQFGPRLTQDLHHALTGHAVDPAMVVLEVTETMLGSDRQWLAGELGKLKATGARVAVDDFGTGYSSLARLRDLPVDIIKIDRMFVSGLTPGAPAQMIAGILQIAASLDMDVVAEGIEQTTERDLLAELGCRLGQGYLYSRPIGLAQAQAMILAGPLIR